MRITNGMLVNTTLTGLNNSMSNINKTYAQMVTGKKVQTVSDDPIIAGRALKLKTSVLENTQYESNTKEASSWMEITEGALTNIHKILEDIRTKCVEASTGTLEKKDKEVIKEEINELMKQLQDEANVTYGGRYVFSGYKTSEPLVLASATELKQNSQLGANLYLSGDVKIVNDDTNPNNKTTIKAGSTLAEGSVLGKDVVLQSGDTLKAGTVLSKKDATALLNIDLDDPDMQGKYQLSGDYTIVSGTEITEDMAKQLALDIGIAAGDFEDFVDANLVKNEDGSYQVTTDITIPKDTKLTKDVASDLLGVTVSDDTYELALDCTLPDTLIGKQYIIQDGITLGASTQFQGDLEVSKGTILAEGTTLLKGSELIKGTTLAAGTLNPLVNGKITGQSIQYEIGVNSTISVNTLNMDEIFSDITKTISEIFAKVDESLEDDAITIEDLHKMFDSKLDEFDAILGEVSKANTDLGSRMSRVEYVESRLSNQKITLKSLLSETEDVNIEEVYVTFNTQYATYQSALQATSKIITNTLADYL